MNNLYYGKFVQEEAAISFKKKYIDLRQKIRISFSNNKNKTVVKDFIMISSLTSYRTNR